MSRVTISYERIDCDICRIHNIGKPNIISVEGTNYEICRDCYLQFKPIMMFLTRGCGLDISWGARQFLAPP